MSRFSRVTLTVSWLFEVSSQRINICGGGFLHLCSRTLLNMCYEYERTISEVWIYRGDAAFFLVITAVAHHVTFSLVLQRMQDKHYQLCGVVLKHTQFRTHYESAHSTPTVLHISVLTALKDSLCSVGGAPLLLLCGL